MTVAHRMALPVKSGKICTWCLCATMFENAATITNSLIKISFNLHPLVQSIHRTQGSAEERVGLNKRRERNPQKRGMAPLLERARCFSSKQCQAKATMRTAFHFFVSTEMGSSLIYRIGGVEECLTRSLFTLWVNKGPMFWG